MAASQRTLQGKVCIVSGATRGLGEGTAFGLAHMGATVIIIGRNPQRIQNTLVRLHKAGVGPAEMCGFQADLASQADVRRVAGEILAQYPCIDVLVNNVGATLMNYQSSADHIEMTWALNYLNHFLLTYLLLGGLKSAASLHGEARIIELTSSIYRLSSSNFHQRQNQQLYNGVIAYAQSKRAIIAYTVEMARRLSGSGVTINAMTPGFVKTGIATQNSRLIQQVMRMVAHFSLPVDEGVQSILSLATAQELCGTSGKYYYQYRQMPDDPSCSDPAVTSHLWQISEQMTGLS